MPMYLSIQTAGGNDRPNLSAPGPNKMIPPQKLDISLYANGEWHCERPIPGEWRYLIPGGVAKGRWQKDMTSTIILKDATSSQTVFELRSSDQGKGAAFHWPRKGNYGATLFDGEGSWGPSSLVFQKSWGGIAGQRWWRPDRRV